MYFLAESANAGVFKSMIRTLLASLCDFVYSGIIMFYQLFMAVGDATILTSTDVQKIFNRVGLILGIIMMFRLIFSFVQYLLDPDKITDKETGVGGLIKKVLVVILALGLVNWVFEKAFQLQDNILSENVIGKIVLGVNQDDKVDMKEFGTKFSYTLFTNFFYLNPELNEDAKKSANNLGCGEKYFGTDGNVGTLGRYVATFNDFENIHNCINEEGKNESGVLFGNKVYYATFHGLWALIVGGFVLWVLAMYTITLGVRVVKLAFLRIIAPVPILSYLSPKKSSGFSNWLKQCITTYLDLFIRIAIIYFAMLLINIIFSRGALLGASTNFAVDGSDTVLTVGLDKWFNIILVLGVLLFAKKLPEILGEIFPAMSGKGGLDFGFGLKSRTDFAGKGLVKRAAGAAIGAGAIGALGGIQGFNRLSKDGERVKGGKKLANTLAGIGSGFGRGTLSGITNGGKLGAGLKKGIRGQVGASEATNKYIAAGHDDFSGRFAAGIAKDLGLPSAYDKELSKINKKQREIDRYNKMAAASSKTSKGFDDIGDALKGEIEGDKSKHVLTLDGSKAALQRMEKEGAIEAVKNAAGDITDYRMIIGQRNVRDANGNVVGKENIIGESVIGQKLSAIDNTLEGKIALAENTLNTANTNLINSKNDRDKLKAKITPLQQQIDTLDGQLSAIDPSTLSGDALTQYNDNVARSQEMHKQLEALKVEYDTAEADVVNYQRQVEDAEVVKNSINKTKFVKTLKQAAVSELLLGNYDSVDISQDLKANLIDADSSMTRASEMAKDLKVSSDAVDVKRGEAYQSASETMSTLKTLLDEIKNAGFVKIENGVVVDYNLEGIDAKIREAKQSPTLINAVDLDVSHADGSYDNVNIADKIETLYDVMDQLSEMNKKVSRNMTQLEGQAKTEKEIMEQSVRVMAAKDAEENRIKFWNK